MKSWSHEGDTSYPERGWQRCILDLKSGRVAVQRYDKPAEFPLSHLASAPIDAYDQQTEGRVVGRDGQLREDASDFFSSALLTHLRSCLLPDICCSPARWALFSQKPPRLVLGSSLAVALVEPRTDVSPALLSRLAFPLSARLSLRPTAQASLRPAP